MSNILLISNSPDFAADLKEQLELYASDFRVFEQWTDDIIFDIAVVDDSPKTVADLQQKLRQAHKDNIGS